VFGGIGERDPAKKQCLFVPPHVLESIARSGREDLRESVRLTIQQSNLVRQLRQDKVREKFSETLRLQQGFAQPVAAQAKRQVWNCQNRWEQRVPPPAQGEGDPPTGEQDVDQMYDYTDIVCDYLMNVLDRNSYDNNGADLNKAFYLVAMDRGTDVAVRIWYHALQNLWATANFQDAVEVIATSARVLVKNGEVPGGSLQTVRRAFKELGLPR
jgi:Zn-dependent metalloprotease